MSRLSSDRFFTQYVTSLYSNGTTQQFGSSENIRLMIKKYTIQRATNTVDNAITFCKKTVTYRYCYRLRNSHCLYENFVDKFQNTRQIIGSF